MNIASSVRAMAAALAVGLALTACSGGGGGATAQDGATGGGEQTLRLAQSAPPSNFTIGNWSGGESILFNSVYDTLLTLDTDGDILPGVAESWEYNEDRTQLTLKIRDGMTFTDGATLDAAAVVASLEAARKGASTSANLASVSSVEAVDDSTVLVTLSQPDAAIIPIFTSTVGAIGSPEVLTAESSKLEPVGSGPYVLDLDETTAGSKYVLTRNPDHWNVDAYPFERVEMSIIADPTAAQNALLGGQLDVLPSAGTQDVLAKFPESKFTNGENKPVAFGALWIVDRAGTVIPALGDVRVRQAINLAFDRESIAKNLTGAGTGPTNQVFSPTGGAFRKDLLEETPFDVKRAQKLMADAGYADGFDVTMPSNIATTQFESNISQSLGEIGINVTWEPVPFQDMYPKVFAGNYAMFFTFNGFSGNDAQDVKASLSGLFNPLGSTTPELEALRAAADAAPDEEQADAFAAVNKYLVDEAWNAPLVWSGGFFVASNDVKYTPPVAYGTNLLPFAPADS
jgi:peptide/nickel transport system substrate-binding protein